MTKLIANFVRNRRGAVALIFALMLVPLVMLIALSIDYSFYVQARSQFGLAADAANLYAIREASAVYTLDSTTSGVSAETASSDAISEGETAGKAWFSSQLGTLPTAFVSANSPNVTLTSTVSGDTTATTAGFVANTAYDGQYPPFFNPLFKQSSNWHITGTAAASTNYGYVELLILLDDSGSMLVSADQGDPTSTATVSASNPGTIVTMDDNTVCIPNTEIDSSTYHFISGNGMWAFADPPGAVSGSSSSETWVVWDSSLNAINYVQNTTNGSSISESSSGTATTVSPTPICAAGMNVPGAANYQTTTTVTTYTSTSTSTTVTPKNGSSQTTTTQQTTPTATSTSSSTSGSATNSNSSVTSPTTTTTSTPVKTTSGNGKNATTTTTTTYTYTYTVTTTSSVANAGSPNAPCAFACHTTNNTYTAAGMTYVNGALTSTSSGTYTGDLYGLARKLGVLLKTDVVFQSTETMLQTLINSEEIPNQFSIGMYSFDADSCPIVNGTTDGTYELPEATTDLSGALTAIKADDYIQTPSETAFPPLVTNADGDTNFPLSISDLVKGTMSCTNSAHALATQSNSSTAGTTPTNPNKDIFIITDGMEDQHDGTTFQSGNSTTCSRMGGEMTGILAEAQDYTDATAHPCGLAVCKTLKNLGFTVYILFVPYPAVQNTYYYDSALGEDPYVASDFPSYTKSNGGTPQVWNEGRADTTSKLTPSPNKQALQACASSPSDFYTATTSSEIKSEMSKMLASALSSSVRITQ